MLPRSRPLLIITLARLDSRSYPRSSFIPYNTQQPTKEIIRNAENQDLRVLLNNNGSPKKYWDNQETCQRQSQISQKVSPRSNPISGEKKSTKSKGQKRLRDDHKALPRVYRKHLKRCPKKNPWEQSLPNGLPS